MIIDCHTHIGKILNFDMREDVLLSSMDKYGIDFALVSNIEGCEVDHSQKELAREDQFDQVELNMKAIELAKEFPDRIGALLWMKPRNEGCDKAFCQMVEENREWIYGLKMHPYLSNMAFDAPEMEGYFELAVEYDLPIVTHTSPDVNSDPLLVEKIGKKYPELKIVLYHMGLGSDNLEAMRIVRDNPNLYGDVAWVKPDKMLEAIKVCGADKMMFGTDNPISGDETYGDERFYSYCYSELKEDISSEDYEKFMYLTAKRLFKIKV